MNSSIFAERFNQTMRNKKIKQIDLIAMAEARGAKLGKSQISQYASGKTQPRTEVLQLLAELLEVDLN